MPLIQPNKELAIVILAAGAGKRMGQIKQLLPTPKSSFLEEIIEKTLKIESSHVYVALGAHYEKIQPKIIHFQVDIIFHKEWQKGLGGTIAYSTQFITKFNKDISAIFFVLVDQPLIDEKYYKSLLNKYLKTNKYIICSNYNNNPGVPAIFGSKYFADLLKLSGDVGAKKLMLANLHDLELIEEQNNLLDIDTEKDYKEYLNSN